MDYKGIISRIPLFENLTDDNLEKVSTICKIKSYGKHKDVFFQGEEGKEVFILNQGAVKLYTITDEGKEVIIKVVKPGEMFGEVILFESEKYPVNATTLKNSQIISFSKSSFKKILEDESFRDAFIGHIMKKMRYLIKQVHSVSSLEVIDRLFLFFREHHGEKKRFNIGLSKKDVAMAIGTTSETLSRTIKKLAACGAMKWEGKEVSIIDSSKCETCIRKFSDENF